MIKGRGYERSAKQCRIKTAIHKGTRLHCLYWQAIFGRQFPGNTYQGYLSWLLGWLYCHCQWTTPGFKRNQAETTSSRQSWLGCFVPHWSAVVHICTNKLSKGWTASLKKLSNRSRCETIKKAWRNMDLVIIKGLVLTLLMTLNMGSEFSCKVIF